MFTFFYIPSFLILVSAYLCKWFPLLDFIGFLWQRQFFTSQLSLGFSTGQLIESLEGGAYYWGLFWVKATAQALKSGVVVLLAGNT